MLIYAETPRLILREILHSDLDGFWELDSDPEVHRYLGNQPVTDKSKLVDVIEFVRQQYIDFGIGRWAVLNKETQEFMGWAGLKFVTEVTNNHSGFYDIGYRLIRKYWGKGYATEASMAALDYAFQTLKLEQLFATAAVDNFASNRVLQKIRLQFVETFYHGDIHCNWYELDRRNA